MARSLIRINFYFDEKTFEGMRRVADLRNTTYSELIRIACREYLVREVNKAIADHKAITEIKSE
jgi:hypothetical protein